MTRLLLLVLILSTQLASSAEVTLEDARKAFIDLEASPHTAHATGKFRVHRQDDNSNSRILWTEGTFSLSYVGPKLLLDLEHTTRKVRVRTTDRNGQSAPPQIVDLTADRVVILADGDSVSRVTFTPRINPSGCRIELYSSLRSALGTTDFPLREPAHPQIGILNIDKLIKNLGSESIEWEAHAGTSYKGSYALKNSNRVHAIFEIDTNSGNQLVSKQVFNRPSTVPVKSQELVWAQSGSVWYVKEVTSKRHLSPSTIPAFTEFSEVTFDTFTVDSEIKSDVFTVASLPIPPGTRTLDRRR